MNTEKTQSRYVLITTKHRGVFGGTLESQEGNRVVLTNARCAIYWHTTGGFIELADVGPNAKTRLGSVAPRIELYDVTSITDCTEVAATKWKEHVNAQGQ